MPAKIVFDVDDAKLKATEELWARYRREARAGALRLRLQMPEDLNWDWPRKLLANKEYCRVVGLTVENEIQGLLMFSTVDVPTRLSNMAAEHTLYIEYIETAPTNRAAYVGEGARYKLVGTQLLGCAVRISSECGFEGRLALHSLAQAGAFYRELGFEHLGFDKEEGYDYFELSADNAKRFM